MLKGVVQTEAREISTLDTNQTTFGVQRILSACHGFAHCMLESPWCRGFLGVRVFACRLHLIDAHNKHGLVA
eukprot:4701825-Amphidinium_carterae.1